MPGTLGHLPASPGGHIDNDLLSAPDTTHPFLGLRDSLPPNHLISLYSFPQAVRSVGISLISAPGCIKMVPAEAKRCKSVCLALTL
jgi:hypothetical protein